MFIEKRNRIKITLILLIILFIALFILIMNTHKSSSEDWHELTLSKDSLIIFGMNNEYSISLKSIDETGKAVTLIISRYGKKQELKLYEGSPITIMGIRMKLIGIDKENVRIGIILTGRIGKYVTINEGKEYCLEDNEYILEPSRIMFEIKNNTLKIWPGQINEKALKLKKGLFRIETSNYNKELILYLMVRNISNCIDLTLKSFTTGHKELFEFKPLVIPLTTRKAIISSNAIYLYNDSGLRLLEIEKDRIIMEIYKEENGVYDYRGIISISMNDSKPIDIGLRLVSIDRDNQLAIVEQKK